MPSALVISMSSTMCISVPSWELPHCLGEQRVVVLPVTISSESKVVLKMSCDRCLKEVDEVINLDLFREVFAPDEIAESTDEKSDQTFMEGYQLNVDDLINDEILLSLPMKVLCKEDCKGICRQCGKDLNEGECGCDTFVPDPRMAVIKDIFNANKEV